MPGYSINQFDSTAEIPSFPDAGALGFVGQSLYGRTPAGTLFGVSPALSKGIAIYLDPLNGADTNDGLSPLSAKATLAGAFALATAGNGDAIYLLSSGETNASARLSATFLWTKDNTHLIGVSSGVNISNRARVAPTAGVTGFTPMITISGNGCLFQNIQFFQGFTAGIAGEINVEVTGGRNLFVNCHLAGLGDTDGGGGSNAGGRDLLIVGTGENQFWNCTIGLDTVARSAANAWVEFQASGAGTPRNVFRNCRFIMLATSSSVLGILVAAASAIDRFQSFEECFFFNALKSTGVAVTGLAKLAANAGGLLFFANPQFVGFTSLGADATSKAQIYVTGPAVSSSVGIGVNPA